MKIFFSLFLVFLLLGCEQSRDAATSDTLSPDGKGGSLATFILKGDYLYTVDQNKLNVISITDPVNPISVNSIPVGFNIETIFSMGNYLFIGSRNGMFIYSIEKNPEQPVYLSQAQHFTACDPVVANATHAFVTLHTNTVCNTNISVNKLLIYNISNINSPIKIAERDLLEPKGMALYKNYLFLCDKTDILVFDITKPESIVLKKSIPNLPAIDLIVDGNNLLAFTSTAVQQYTIDPMNIQSINHVSTYSLK